MGGKVTIDGPNDTNGDLKVGLGSLLSGENQALNRIMITPYYNATQISVATTMTLKSSPGIFGGIKVQGGTAGTIKIYDNTAGSGTLLADYDSTNALMDHEYGVATTTGLTVVTSAATKITITWI